MNLYTVPFYRNAPFLRIVSPFTCGILIQFYINLSPFLLGGLFVPVCIVLFSLRLQTIEKQFVYRAFKGSLVNLLIALSGAICLYLKSGTNDRQSIYHQYTPGSKIILAIDEPLTEKTGSYKTTGLVRAVIRNKKVYACTGKILIYVGKDALSEKLKYGAVITVTAPLQLVATSGNPGAFDYQRYCYLQGIYFQVFLSRSTYTSMNRSSINRFRLFIFDTRKLVIKTIDRFINGKKEAGLAQAILIGYKDNLDKALVQAYADTGVVHVIAISGLHLGLIYAILLLITARFPATVTGRILQLLVVLAGIWVFAVIAGASASVIRSAVMFTCIATGKVLAKKLTIYNSLAASAFLLLSYNPFWLWDTGFQLSYAAVLSIVIYQKPVYNCLPLENPLLIMLWKTCAVTVSAQILTTPVSLYYFHQFPLFFIVTNFVAIPLSSLILLLEIALCSLGFLSPIATLLGQILFYLIRFMNWFIDLINRLPYSNWRPLQIDTLQYILLLVSIAGFTVWLFQTNKTGFWIGLFSLLLTVSMRANSFNSAVNQQKIIVYNISKAAAAEVIEGRNSLLLADSSVLENDALLRFNIIPSRILHRLENVCLVPIDPGKNYFLNVGGGVVIILRSKYEGPTQADLIIISGNPRGSIYTLVSGKFPRFIVFDSSNSRSQVARWQRECASHHIPCHSVAGQGAFVMNLN